MKYSCVIIDDEKRAQDLLEYYLLNCQYSIEIKGKFGQVKDAMSLLDTNEIDILFLDINLPFMSGVDFVKKYDVQCKIIFCTSHSEFAVEAFDLDVHDFIVKPFTPNRIIHALNKTITVLELEQKAQSQLNLQDFYQIKDYNKVVNIIISDILYIKSELNYIEIITLKKRYIERKSLKSILEDLPSYFMQVHKSYIVNLKS